MITVQTNDFSVADEYQRLLTANTTGAVVIFTGLVREFSGPNTPMGIQHYPGMTESVLEKIEKEAQRRWPLLETRIIHRVGELAVNEQIVFVGVSSAHRKAAFEACEYMIDVLKTQAPFWKKEGGEWVDAKDTDQRAADAWLSDKP
ncbi:MAG: molybdenum cofactor biosynthesis protein MoaE [Agarilytica sp.]